MIITNEHGTFDIGEDGRWRGTLMPWGWAWLQNPEFEKLGSHKEMDALRDKTIRVEIPWFGCVLESDADIPIIVES